VSSATNDPFNVGGIRYQIEDGIDGFLVSSNEDAAERIVRLLKDEKLREEMGRKARETVREKFLLTRHVEEYLDLFGTITTFVCRTDPPLCRTPWRYWLFALPITPQAIRAPESPAGCDLRSSAFA
jgi:hypothetical protein